MTITVIIPTLNEAPQICETIRRTAALGFTDIILVDGGSSDGTADSARATGLVRVLASPPGRARQMNRGAGAAEGDLLLFLHADTELPENAKAAIDIAVRDPLVVGGRFDVQFASTSRWGRIISALMNARSRLTRIATGDQALFIRKHVFHELGGFADIPLMEDVEFSRRLKRIGHTIALRDRVTTSFRRWEQAGPVKTILLMWVVRFLYWMNVSPFQLSRWYRDVR